MVRGNHQQPCAAERDSDQGQDWSDLNHTVSEHWATSEALQPQCMTTFSLQTFKLLYYQTPCQLKRTPRWILRSPRVDDARQCRGAPCFLQYFSKGLGPDVHCLAPFHSKCSWEHLGQGELNDRREEQLRGTVVPTAFIPLDLTAFHPRNHGESVGMSGKAFPFPALGLPGSAS